MDANKEDVKNILELLKRCLPDFSVKRDDLLKPTPSFAISFYHSYVNVLEEECKLIFTCSPLENIGELCSRDIDRERFVFLFTRHILNRIGIQYFSMLDFYRPTNRTKTTIKACMYFLLYFKENSPVVKDIISDFYRELSENNSRADRIIAKKTEISEISQNIGLIREKMEVFQRDYEAELRLESELAGKGDELDKEIDELQNEFDTLSHNVYLQEKMLDNLKDETHNLSQQIVSENDYEFFCKDRLNQLQIKIADDDRIAGEQTKVLEAQHKELELLKKAVDILKQEDMLGLDNLSEIEHLEEKIKELDSVKQEDINNLNQILKAKTQSMQNRNDQFEEEKKGMDLRLVVEQQHIQAIDESIISEKLMQEELVKEDKALKKQLEDSEKECTKLENDQDLLEEEHQNIYENLLTQQNLITTTFNNGLEDIIGKYKPK